MRANLGLRGGLRKRRKLEETEGEVKDAGGLVPTEDRAHRPLPRSIRLRVRFTRESVFRATVAEVFAFHEAPDALESLTPPWERVRILRRGGSLLPGARVTMAVRIGPFWRTWEAEHTRYRKDAFFEDVQVRGPFARWRHLHRFEEAPGGCCRLIDEIEYELPLGALGRVAGGRLVERKLERLFAFRHEVTRRAVERGPSLTGKTCGP